MKILSILFTYNTSLEDWEKNGSLDRELNIYKKLLSYFDKIYLITYGSNDLVFQKQMPENVRILPKKYSLHNLLYSFLIPFVHKKIIKKSSWIKTNQMLGSWTAVLIKILFKKKIFVRTGYTESLSYVDKNIFRKILIYTVEYIAYRTADISSVTSKQQTEYIKRKYKPKNIHTLRNGIDIKLFKPIKKKGSSNKSAETKLLFIGRLHKEKNIVNLIKALRNLEYISIKIIGGGPLKNKIKQLSQTCNINATFINKIPNSQLPKIYNEADIYIQPSLYEGNPKTILEAMACGLPVIASQTTGINNIIKHKQTGFFCQKEPGSIKKAILTLQNNQKLREKIGRNARQYIIKNYNLSDIIKKEIALYKKYNE